MTQALDQFEGTGDTDALPPASRASLSTLAAPPRRYELDWLRILAVFGLIPFHAAIIFSLGGGDYIKNATRSAIMGQIATFVTFWGIPLLFLVAGASSWFALSVRAPGDWVRERIKRLLVPFVFGVLAIVPIQVYFGRLSDPRYHEPYPVFYVQFFAGFRLDRVADYLAHLWFVPCLLAYSLLALPLLDGLRHPAGRRVIAALGRMCERPGAILLLALPLGTSDMILRGKPLATLIATYLRFDNWALFVYFLLFFLYGYVLYADPRIVRAICRDGPMALIFGVVFWLIAQQLLATHALPRYEYSLSFIAAMFVRGCVSWFWIVAITSMSLRVLTFTNALLHYLDEAFYPVYVLHMPVLTMVAFFIVQAPLGIWGKFVLIVVATFAMTLGLYELCIRRLPAVRFLFGMRPLPARDPRIPIAPEHLR